ncbi:hypothetical protein RPALISO_187 [Ruegeria phage RpAliso]|nr:hypothetical protein RPALISO_187 [Ruegeria phage RpAliso]
MTAGQRPKRRARKKWTDAEIRSEAAKSPTRGEFKKNSNGAYMAAWRRGLLDELMPPDSRFFHK